MMYNYHNTRTVGKIVAYSMELNILGDVCVFSES